MNKLAGQGVSGAAVALTFAVFSKNINWIPHGSSRAVQFFSKNQFASAILGLIIGASCFTISQWLRWEIIRKLLTYRDWIYSSKSWKTKAWGIMLKVLMPKQNPVNSLQNYLPKYPLPKLEETCEKSLVMVRPLLSDNEFELIVKAMEDFKNNEGPVLQKILEKRYRTEVNWVTELWDKYAYLAGRSPIPVHSNFSTSGVLDFTYNSMKQASQAANIVYYFLEYDENFWKRSMSHMMIQNVVPICCDRYKYVLSTTRIPGKEIDELIKFPHSKHIIVFRNNFMYKVFLYAQDTSGKETLLTPRELQSQLEKIMSDADAKDQSADKPAINPSVFTTANRTRWAQIRKRLQKDSLNARSLEDVESACLCLILDDSKPETISDEFHLFLTGNGFDRWFDKSLCVIVAANNAFGYNLEHSTAEATVAGRMHEYCLYHSKYDISGNAVDGGRRKHKSVAQPQLLEWNLNEFTDEIAEVKTDWDKLASDVDTHAYLMDKGKSFMKKLRLSPDGYMQMSLQLAFYRLHKEIPKTYETGTTRLFKLGRTETIRPVSEHSVAFVKKFDDPSVPASEKIRHLKDAISYQTKYKFDAMNGKAVDRHLFGLYVAGKLTGSVPKLFTMRPFCETDRLSTSQSPLRYDPAIYKRSSIVPMGGGFGPQHPHGYGVAYFIEENKVVMMISSFKSSGETKSDMFARAIQSAVDDIKALLETAASKQPQSNGVNHSK